MKKANISIRDLYPELTEEELNEAEDNLKRYIEIADRIGNRLAAEELSRSNDHLLP
jgi:hypothetical protein